MLNTCYTLSPVSAFIHFISSDPSQQPTRAWVTCPRSPVENDRVEICTWEPSTVVVVINTSQKSYKSMTLSFCRHNRTSFSLGLCSIFCEHLVFSLCSYLQCEWRRIFILYKWKKIISKSQKWICPHLMKFRVAIFSGRFLIKLRWFTDFRPSNQPREELSRKCGNEVGRMTQGLSLTFLW